MANAEGKPVPRARVSISYWGQETASTGLSRGEFSEGDGPVGWSDDEGNFRLDLPRGGYFRVQAGDGESGVAVAYRHPRPGRFEERVDFRLARDTTIVLRGRLLHSQGGPLTPEEVRFLFPDDFPASEDAREIGVSGIWALVQPCLRPSQAERGLRASIDEALSTFEIRARSAEWSPFVAALSRGRVLAQQRWRKGEPEVEIRFDVPRLRAELGSLEVRVLDAAAGGPVPGATVGVVGQTLGAGANYRPSLPVDPDSGLRFPDVFPGTYTLLAQAGGYGGRAERVEVAGGKTTRTALRLARPAEVVLRLLGEEGWVPGGWGLQYFDPTGTALPCAAQDEAGSNGSLVRVSGLPPGAGWIVLAGNALRVRLAPGSNGELDFPIRRLRTVRAKWRPIEGKDFPQAGEARLLREGQLPVAQGAWSLGSGEAWDWIDFAAPPGSYLLDVEFAAGARARREVVVGIEDSTELEIEPR
ncbi:MAG TPA: carboxypeptidase-like regulatory domain-containing protein [Planctomycetota bacterium]|nr:carboxypeptidase-like regulatory domain-containing protein [Planctomycetota bacterium]